jgi:DNA-binding NtrC family response regulator
MEISGSLQDNLAPVIERLERSYLESVLRRHGGRITETAGHAGISRHTLLRKLKFYGIDKREFKA